VTRRWFPYLTGEAVGPSFLAAGRANSPGPNLDRDTFDKLNNSITNSFIFAIIIAIIEIICISHDISFFCYIFLWKF